MNRRVAFSCMLLLNVACARDDAPLEGPLRVRALAASGDTLRWLVEGAATGTRVLRPTAELSITAQDSAGAEPQVKNGEQAHDVQR